VGEICIGKISVTASVIIMMNQRGVRATAGLTAIPSARAQRCSRATGTWAICHAAAAQQVRVRVKIIGWGSGNK
jgi:hypothetical protein